MDTWTDRIARAEVAAAKAAHYDDGVAKVLQQWVGDIKRAYDLEHKARMETLRLLAWKGILAGLAVFWFGGPATFEEAYGNFWRLPFGYLSVLAGCILMAGAADFTRGWAWRYRMQVLGLGMLGLWDALIAAQLLVAAVTYDGPWTLGSPWTDPVIPLAQPRGSTFLVYLLLSVLMWRQQLRAVLRDGRST